MFKILVSFLLLSFALIAPAGAQPATAAASNDTITLGGGCFWCLEAVFTELKGVTKVESGYAGGHVVNPTYTQVSNGDTGHAEVVQLTYDPQVITLSTILHAYFTIHDPTTVNRQGNDYGSQYRCIAFYRNDAQKTAIEQAIKDASADWSGPIVTEVKPFSVFYKAEDYHQEYFKLHGENPYCSLIIAPKVAKFRKKFHDYLK